MPEAATPAGRLLCGARRAAARRGGDAAAVLLLVPLFVVVLAPGWILGDDDLHPIRLFEQDLMIRAGQFPVRWYPDVAGGYGSPHPLFYAPLFYLIAQVFLFAGLSITASLKAAILLVLAGTSVAMYRLAREFFGEGPALVAAAAYSYAPYHLVDLFVRTAFSETTAFLFLPLGVLVLHRLGEKATPGRIAQAGAAICGLLLAHTTVSLLILPPVLAGYAALAAPRAPSRRTFIAAAAAAGLLGVALAAFFVIPLLGETGAVETGLYTEGGFDYHRHFVSPLQLLYSPWGFGESVEGPGDGMSFRLGLLQILGCALAAIRWRRIREMPPPRSALLVFAAAVSLGGAFMCLGASAALWEALPPLRFLSFPWRFLILPAFGLALITGAAAAALSSARRRPLGLPAGALIGVLFAAASYGMLGVETRAPLQMIRFRRQEPAVRRFAAADPGARAPEITREFVLDQLLNWVDHLPPGAYPPPPAEDLKRPKAEIVRGRAEVTSIEERPVRYKVGVRASETAVLRLNVHRFPGWHVYLDGQPVEPGPPDGRRPVLTVTVPSGDHEVTAAFERTVPGWLGDLTSLAALGLTAGLALMDRRRRRV